MLASHGWASLVPLLRQACITPWLEWPHLPIRTSSGSQVRNPRNWRAERQILNPIFGWPFGLIIMGLASSGR
jgi:hypothetical protein